MADQVNYDSTQPVRSQVTANYNPTGLNNQANLDAYNAGREQKIQNVYDKALGNTQASLKTAYDQNLSDLQAARDKITPQYQASINQLTSEYERQRRNNNLQAAANGLNTGAGSQMQLGQMNIYASQNAGLRRAENEALNEANRGIADLGVRYQNDIAQAVANNDYKLAAAMLDEYENQYNRQMNLENTNYQRERDLENQAYQRAYQEENRDYNRNWNQDERDYERAWNTENRDYTRAYNEENRDYTRAFNEENRDYERAYNEENRDYTRAWNTDERNYDRNWNENERDYDRTMTEASERAQYGDFSGYAQLYGSDIANSMREVWIAQNPMVAYSTGAITADEYMMLTGKYPYNYGGGSSGGSSYGRSGGGGGYGGGNYGTNPASPNPTGEDYSIGDIYAMEASGLSPQEVLSYIQRTSANPTADVAKASVVWQGQNNAVEDMWARNSLSDASKQALNGVGNKAGAVALANAALNTSSGSTNSKVNAVDDMWKRHS